jgi:hypothetical protein
MQTFSRTALATALLVAFQGAHADTVTDWNQKTNDLIAEAKIGTPPAVRLVAIVQTAAYQALERLPRGASGDAALAAAHRATLVKLLPAQQATIDAAAHTALAAIADGPAKELGVAAGDRAAAAVLAERLNDGIAAPDTYRPHTTPGAYVPTAPVVITTWAQRKPWHLASAAQFRPGPPPALAGEAWARDVNEVRAVGSRSSTRRTAEQTDIARFWEYSLPAIYHGVLRSVALQPQRTVLANARLFAVAAQAMDDGLIADGDAKYVYNFWRPITAIRNGDNDGNDATPRDAGWQSLIDSPMHAEYPSAHATLAGVVSAVVKAELAGAPGPVLSTASPTAKGATRRWTNVDDFAQEVADSRVWGGIHYRSSINAGLLLGRQIGQQAVRSFSGAP